MTHVNHPIIRLAHLVEFLCNPETTKAEKVEELNAAMRSGELSEEEAVELAIEYC